MNRPNKYLLSTYLAGCCIHRGVNQDRFGICFPSPSSLVGCQPTKSKSPGQIQGDSTNRPYCPLLLTPEFTHLTLTWGGRTNVIPCGEVVERAGWKGPLMGASSTLSKQEQRLCHCGQEATNATRIIHDNYNQVRAEEKMRKMAMTSRSLTETSASSPLKLIHLLNMYLLQAFPVLCVCKQCVVLNLFANFLGSPSPLSLHHFLMPSYIRLNLC